MTARPTLTLVLVTIAVVAPALARAEESLLWKALNNNPAQVVPAYAGQGSPFPMKVAPAVAEVSATELMDEKARQREEALNYAQGILKGGSALKPEIGYLRTGGVLVGNLGPKVLINNQWLGVGQHINVRQVKTTEALNALKALAEYDSTAAADLGDTLSKNLASKPTVALTIQQITSSSVVLQGPGGRTVLPIAQAQ